VCREVADVEWVGLNAPPEFQGIKTSLRRTWGFAVCSLNAPPEFQGIKTCALVIPLVLVPECAPRISGD